MNIYVCVCMCMFQTSLELAVQHNASESIVKLLLETGAKPISSEFICDSAVLLASKQSSPLLPLLLNYVTEPQLLNREDSSGKHLKIK